MAQRFKALISARCVTTDPGSIPGCVAAGRDLETHEAAHNWPGGMSLSHCALAPRCDGLPAAFGRQVYGVSSEHIGAAGFRVKWALCQDAVLRGWVVFQRTQGS